MSRKPTKRPPGRPRNPDKPQQFSVRMSADVKTMLTEFAELYGVSISGAVVRCILIAHSAIPSKEFRVLKNLRTAREAHS